MLIAHKLKIDAVHNSTSNDIQILQNTQPSCHDPAGREKKRKRKRKLNDIREKQIFNMFPLQFSVSMFINWLPFNYPKFEMYHLIISFVLSTNKPYMRESLQISSLK